MPPDYRTLEGLPDDVLFEIINNLYLSDIISVCLSSRELNARVCKNEVFWQRYIMYRSPEEAGEKRTDQTWREFAQYLFSGVNHRIFTAYDLSLVVLPDGRIYYWDIDGDSGVYNPPIGLKYVSVNGNDIGIDNKRYTQNFYSDARKYVRNFYF